MDVLSETDTLMLRADEAKITQVVYNLLHNAVQYTPQHGNVRIVLKATPSDVKIVFANSGGEIDAADLPYMFERFYRGEKSRSREQPNG